MSFEEFVFMYFDKKLSNIFNISKFLDFDFFTKYEFLKHEIN